MLDMGLDKLVENYGLSVRQATALRYLAQGSTKTFAAQMAGVHFITVFRWCKQDQFKEALGIAAQAVIDEIDNDLKRRLAQ